MGLVHASKGEEPNRYIEVRKVTAHQKKVTECSKIVDISGVMGRHGQGNSASMAAVIEEGGSVSRAVATMDEEGVREEESDREVHMTPTEESHEVPKQDVMEGSGKWISWCFMC